MTRVLNVAEKPSVARALAGVFAQSQGSRDKGMTRNNAAQVFTCENVTFPNIMMQGDGRHHGPGTNRPHTMITTSVRGHLASQDFGAAFGWSSCPPAALFDAPIETIYNNDMEPLKNMLVRMAREADAIILWLDCDREGEAISAEVRQVCLEGNPRLRDKIYRAKFSTVLPQEIRRALQSLGRINENFVNAVEARSEHDLRVGAAFTRFQTLRLQKKFNEFADGSQGVISYGPCQFPTLGFVVERWARIQTFIPEDFWFIEMSITLDSEGNFVENGTGEANNQQRDNRSNTKNVFLKWKRDRLYDRVLTMSLYESCLDVGQAVVVSLEGRPKNKWRPIPLATVELQKRASRYLRIGSERLMTAAEELYQQGLISYPRTETEIFRPEFQHIPLIRSFQAIDGEFGDYASKLLSNNNFQNPRAGRNDDKAHPPISPCKAVDPSTIGDPNQRNVYILVVKHYLACCSRDAIGKETELKVKMASEEFAAKGLMVLEKNWLEIYSPWERWSTGQGELPNVQVGSRFTPTSLIMKDGTTSPPTPITEVELISLMDRNGIGTDATIAQHITTIQERKYAEKDGSQRFMPTKLGIALVEGYNSMGYQLNRPDLRREMEAECNAVALGRKRKEDIMGPILRKMLECFNKVSAEAQKLDQAVARHFTRIGSDTANSIVLRQRFSLCGTCDGHTSLRQLRGVNNSRGRRNNNNNGRAPMKLVHCSDCSLGMPLPAKGSPEPASSATQEAIKCPICNFQVISIQADGDYTGNGYNLCPKCFSDPPVEHGGSTVDFRCFQCTHPTCTLAQGSNNDDIEVFPCPFCADGSGKICLKKNQKGSYVLSCSNYRTTKCSFTIWMPREARSVDIIEEDASHNNQNEVFCGRCSNPNKTVRKLKFQWKNGSVPPGIPRILVACVLCNNTLKSDFGLTVPQVNQVQIHNRRSGNSTNSRRTNPSSNSNNRGRGRNFNNTTPANSNNNGGIVCFRCNQPGHYASNCPNNSNR